jgi:pilus assembly protein Flp/PilA
MRRNRRGTTAIEYATIASLIAVALVVALTQLGTVVEVFYSATSALLTAAV